MVRHSRLTRPLFGAAFLPTVSLAGACVPAQPPAEPSSSEPVFGPSDLPPGSHVLVNKNGQWLPATIVQPLGGDRFVVGYDGFGSQWNEPVGMDRIKILADAAGTSAHDYRVG